MLANHLRDLFRFLWPPASPALLLPHCFFRTVYLLSFFSRFFWEKVMRSAASWGIWKVGICLILNLEIMKHNLNFKENTGGYSLPLKKSLLIVKVSAAHNSKI